MERSCSSGFFDIQDLIVCPYALCSQTRKRLKASEADEDVHEEVVQMQNIVKCFRRLGNAEKRAVYI